MNWKKDLKQGRNKQKVKNIYKILLGIFGVLVLGVIFFFSLVNLNKSQKVIVETDRKEYKRKDKIKLRIRNELSKKICFSSCYPYFFERKKEKWESHLYEGCGKTDFIEICVAPDKEKYFEIEIAYLEEGLHRLSIPICINCKVGDFFTEDQKIFSNEFLIK
jgi:hypothetical protein